MNANEISFENLPKAVAHLVDEVAEIKSLVQKGQTPPPPKRIPIGIDDTCKIIGKAKPTVYALLSASACSHVTRAVRNFTFLKMN